MQTVDAVRNLTLEEATKIYKAHYWNPLNLDLVANQAIATAIFDMSVLRGPSVAGKYAQQALVRCGYGLTVDGHIGVNSLAALNKVDPVTWLMNYEKLVESGFLGIVKNNPSQNRFLKGWLNRARRLLSLLKLGKR